jgi:cytochrome P450
MLSQYLTHRHPEFWPEPERFAPERFGEAVMAGRPRYAHFPFGGGPRVCLGNSFALLEATLAVAMVAQRYRLRLVPGQTITPMMLGTLRPSGPVMMRLEARERALAAQ